MAKIPFNVDANTARLIGRENVSKLDGAIIEIIKNAYDADATICALYFDADNQKLWIVDNGCGMDEDIVKKHWMSIGFSDKDVELKSEKGRIKTGAKGIGRFALDRLGADCTMYTYNGGNHIVWHVNWEEFVRGVNINDVYADLENSNFVDGGLFEEIKNNDLRELVINSFNTGTIFEITGLRDAWDESFLERLRNNLTSLIPPSLSNSFKVYLYSQQTQTQDAQIVSELLSSYDYAIDFDISQSGDVKISILRNEFEFGTKFDYIIENAGFDNKDRDYFNGEPIIITKNIKDFHVGVTEDNPYSLGAFSGKICFYKIVSQEKNEVKYYYKPFEHRKSLIKKYGGIKIYRDGFRVRPYGESGTPQFDWLLLSARHYISAYPISSKLGNWTVDSSQVIGEINISRLNETLNDQANREGIFEDRDFDVFKKIIVEILSYLETDRQDVIRKLSDLWDKNNQAQKAENDIRDKYERYQKNKGTKKNSESEKSEKDNEKSEKNDEYVHVEDAQKAIEGKEALISDLEDENRLLRSLATTGIAINTYMHEIRALIHDLKMNSKRASEAYRIRNDIEEAVASINEVRSVTKDFESWFQVTIGSTRADKRTRQKINVVELISKCIESWKKSLGDDIEFETTFSEDEIYLVCFPYEIESILHNLISNSFKSFKRGNTTDKTISLVVTFNDGKLKLSYSDNGEGLLPEFKENPDIILKQMVTGDIVNGQKQGTGLGMWIVNNIISDYKGKIDLTKNIKSESGFYIDIII